MTFPQCSTKCLGNVQKTRQTFSKRLLKIAKGTKNKERTRKKRKIRFLNFFYFAPERTHRKRLENADEVFRQVATQILDHSLFYLDESSRVEISIRFLQFDSKGTEKTLRKRFLRFPSVCTIPAMPRRLPQKTLRTFFMRLQEKRKSKRLENAVGVFWTFAKQRFLFVFRRPFFGVQNGQKT